ncbi:MAG: carbon monoxide dehydrogenase [Dactylosporangium sp.]|jgi:carbon monoxide dehydrogenase subunit G|nr:carbon monoxide dehydrogenase [Dactylosporangium sp.]
MRLDHSFTVPVPVERAWEVLLDLPRIAPCMPGATLTGMDGDRFTGTVKVKLGPIALTYQGKGRFVERDEAARRVVIEASGKDTRSAGTAAATVTAVLTAEGDATRVEVGTDLTVTGRPAQFGRGMIADVGAKLIGQFADCVASTLSAGPAEPSVAQPAPAAEPARAALPEPAAEPARAALPEPADQAQPAQPAAHQAHASSLPAEAEPIDLLKLTGSTATARRLARYAVGALLLATLTWVTVRWLRR